MHHTIPFLLQSNPLQVVTTITLHNRVGSWGLLTYDNGSLITSRCDIHATNQGRRLRQVAAQVFPKHLQGLRRRDSRRQGQLFPTSRSQGLRSEMHRRSQNRRVRSRNFRPRRFSRFFSLSNPPFYHPNSTYSTYNRNRYNREQALKEALKG